MIGYHNLRSSILLLSLLLSIQLWGQNIPNGYYDSAEGKKKAELKSALHEVIKDAHVLSYGSGAGATWSGFVQVDIDIDGYYVDMYSPNKAKANGNSAGSGMNIEHSFAKSWWGRTKKQAYKDIQQLRPSNSKANSSKGSWPMAVVDGKTTYDNGVIKVGKSSNRPGGEISAWEPSDEFKGDFARIYMYMVTCYEDFDQLWTGNSVNQLDNNKYPVFEPWTVNMLLEWCRKDPVSDWEIQRNDKVYGIQGNRNPYVDYPELAEYVWGDKTEEPWYPGGSKDPIINSPRDGSVIDMGATAIGKSLVKEIRVSARNLEENITVAVSGTGFTVTPSVITKEEALSGKIISVTYLSSVTADSSGVLTLRSGNLLSTVTLNALAVDGIPALPAKNVMTTSFIACWNDVLGGEYDLNVYASDGITLLQGYPVKVNATKGEYAVSDLRPKTNYFYRLSQGNILSNMVKVITATPVPVMSISLPDGNPDFVAIPGEQAKTKRVVVHAEYLEHGIEAAVDEPFQISTDEETWDSSLTLDKDGGVIFVRMPASNVVVRYEGTLSLSVADIPEPEEIDITGIVEEQKSFKEDFEKGTKGSYDLGNVNCTMGEWTMNDAGIWGQSGSDRYHGKKAVRMGKNAASYICTREDRVKGIGTMSFYAGVFGTDKQASVGVSYSTDGGNTWEDVSTFTIPNDKQLAQYRCAINVSEPVRIKFEKKSGERFNIDDIEMSDYIPVNIGRGENLPVFQSLVWDGKLVVLLENTAVVNVYTVNGMNVYNNTLPSGVTKISLPKGMYIVRCGTDSRKIFIF